MNWIELYQNIANFIICTSVSATLYAYYYIDNKYIDYGMYLILPHFASDLFITNKLDLKLHHIFGIIFIAYRYIINVDQKDYTTTIITLYNTEISTFFYVLKLFIQEIPNKKRFQWLITINDILFFTTFFKYRIIDFYYNLIMNHDDIYNYSKYPYFEILLFAIHGMYILNLYWFNIICKIIFKPFVNIISNRDLVCHKITTYTLFFNVLIGAINYTSQPHDRNMYHICGLFLLSIASSNYHEIVSKKLEKNKEIEYISSDITIPYLQDIGSIHFCSFTAILTNFMVNMPSVVQYSMYSHIIFYTIGILNIVYKKYKNRKIFYGDGVQYNNFIKFQYICVMTPTAIDIISICINTFDIVESIHSFYITVMMGILFTIMPFYELSHIWFHIYLMIHTYMCVHCNMYSIKRDELLL